MKNDYIGLLVEDTHSLLIGLLGILKSGNCIVPISPGFPTERLEFIVKDCRIKVLLTDKKNDAAARQIARTCSCLQHVICIDDIEFKNRDKPGYPYLGTGRQDMDKPCYVIYTSGSTGKPKGVQITYGNLIPLLLWFHNYFKLGGHIRVLQNLSYTFDFGMFELLTTLLAGGTLYFFNKKALKDLNEYVEFIHLHHINCIHTTPSFFNNIAGLGRKLSPLKLIHLGGEQLSRKLVEEISKLVGENCYIYNGYGPTETTINSSIFSLKVEVEGRIDVPDNIPIGKPSVNNVIYILDADGMFLPIGITGELYITGSGVAPGYLNKPELTAEKFCLRQPGGSFCKNRPLDPHKNFLLNYSPLYQTGDLGRWLFDGNIEYLGRIDHQIKIRGFRIELGEIENRLLSHKEIKECAVTVRKGEKGNKYLCAYLVVRSSLTSGALREYSSKYLPDYMTPSYFVMIDKMPLTTSGKIDLKALPEPGLEARTGYTAPRDGIEEKLAEIWADVLGIDKDNIGIDSDFFELGGHSLKATLLTAKIHKGFHVKLPLVEIFKTPFIRGLAVNISEAAKDKYISLETAEKKEYYALSSAQKRLYVLQQMDEQGVGITYNIPSVWILEGTIDKSRLEDTFFKLIRRHESLRTSFHMVDEEVVQRIHEENPKFQIPNYKQIPNPKLKIPNTSSLHAPCSMPLANLIKNFVRHFDLSQAPLLRVGLVELEAQSYLLMIDIHHIVSDGTSMGLLVDDFISLYKGEGLSSLRLQYRDYAQWQNHRKQSELIKKQEAYWLKEFRGEIPLLNLPTDFKRPITRSFEGETLVFQLGKEKTKQLKTLALEEDSTLFMVLLCLFYILLSKLSSQEDIVVGTPVANRRHAGLESIMGMFVNTLALRNSPVGEKTVTRFLKEVKERSLTAFENQEYPFEDLVEKMSVNRDTGRNPLFDVMFDLQPISIDKIEIPGLKLEPYNYTTNTAKFDLMLQVVEEEENLRFIFEYSTKLFKDETIRRFIGFFKKIAEVLVENPALQLEEIDIVSEEDRQQILMDLNDTETEYPKDKVIHQLFEEQVERIPDQIALIGQIPNKNVSLTYKELNERSGQLACLLKEKGVKPDTASALMIERSIEMIVGILGILKAGGAYLPIDPQYPEERKQYMLKDSNAKILLAAPDLTSAFEPSLSTLTSTCQVSSTNLAYIIYTSGTTGKPKGVMIQHCNVVRLMFNDKFQFDFNNTDVWTMFHSYCFDFSVWEMYGALLYGGKLVLIPKATARESQRYLEVLKKQKVTILNQTPSAFYNLINMELQNPGKELYIRWVIFGGEALTPVRLKEWKAKYPGTKLINMYGITETTVHVTFKEIKDKEIASTASSIGKPIPTLSTYVLDKALKLLPIGVPGELCVGGKGVGRGYLNQPELTGDKFINNPYIPGERLYRSGDLVKMSARGDMEYLGRMDHQVKIRGFRIELAEIESQLLSHGEVEEVVVIVKENNAGDKHLCAYVAAHKDGLTAPGLREYLLKKLPGYMVPSFFIFLEGIPLTPNGKVDRKALPGPEIKAGQGYTAPGNEVEEKLVGIWAETLDIPQNTIGIDCSFFELGGHSLKASLLASKVHKALDVSISLVDIFSTPTIRELAAYIKKAAKDEYIPIIPEEKKEYYTLSSAQGRLYVLHQMDEQGIGYNIPSVWNVGGDIDTVKFEKVFRELIRRHESLRTSFHVVHEEPVQRIKDKNFKFQITKYKQIPNDKFQITKAIKEFIRPFDLSRMPLFRVGLIHTPAYGRPSQEGIPGDKHILMVDMHHIITDGTSMGVFVKDFMSLFREEKLPSLRVQYKEFSRWQKSGGVKASLKEQEEYWLREFPGEIPVLDLPIDHARPLVQVFEGNTLGFELNKEETGKLKTLAREQDITLFMLLFCVYTVFLTKLSGQEDIVVGSPVAGRRHADLEPVIGMFVNTLALRSFPASGKTFGQFLREVKERTLTAFENQDYPFEELVEQVDVNRDTSRNPLFDTMFVLQNTDTTDIDIPGLILSPYKRENKTSKFDLTLSGSEVEDKLLFTFEYSTKLFKESTIGRFIRYFRKTLYTVLEKPYIPLSGIEIISGEEKQQILFEFNDTRADYPQNKTIHELFEEQADRTPDGVAVVGAHELHEFHEKEKRAVGDTQDVGMTAARPLKGFIASVTYRELNREANQLACLLRIKGVLANDIVAIMVERSIEMVIGILGILKAGGAYLPVDPGYLRKRIDYMLKDSSVKVLVTINTLTEEVEKLKSDEIEQIFSTSQPLNFSTSQPSHPAYVIYTSGSTGKPRGVLVEHQSVVNLVFSLKDKIYHCGQSEPAALISPIVFDASIKQIFTNLVWGNRLVIVPEEIRLDGKELVRFYKRHDIKISDGTPIHLDILLNDASGSLLDRDFPVKRFAIGGDTLKYSTAEALFRAISHSGHGVGQESVELINVYGPTECCDVTAVYAVTRGTLDRYHFLPIGKPLENTSAYIVGKTGELLPIGIAGELRIGGKGLARGYLNNPELTAERFIRAVSSHSSLVISTSTKLSPYSPHSPHLPYSPIYRTGDLARWLPDGNIEFLGRIDHQVKIRGYRVELGDIESQLLTHHAIKKAAVVLREKKQGDQKYLCGYFVSDLNLPVSLLREHLLETLPDYMIPSYFVRVEKIPTTPNGKLDKKALPAPEIKAGEGYVPPLNKMEEKLVEIWAEVLSLEKDKIGIHDSFFQLGGHSLKAILLVSRIHKELNVKVPLTKVFQTPSIRGLAEFIKGAEEYKFFSLEKAEKKEYYPLSSSQMRLYILQQMVPETTGYNMPTMMKLKGELDRDKFEKTFMKLIGRHESLRTSFEIVKSETVQCIHDEVEFEIEYYDMKEVEVEVKVEVEEEKTHHSSKNRIIHHSFIRPFDLSHAPLLRVGLLPAPCSLPSASSILMLDIHHIISDGISNNLLINDFMALYAGKVLPDLRIQYKDFSEWQIRIQQGESIKHQEEYWLKEFAGELPVLNLPVDYVRPVVQDFEGTALEFELEKKDTLALKSLAYEQGTTLYMILLSLYTIFLSKLTNQEDIVVGTPVAGRRHADLENIIGVFVNTLALRNFPLPGKTFARFLAEVKKRTLESFAHQDYPYEDLVEAVVVQRDTSRNPLFDNMFVMHNIGVTELEIPGMKLSRYDYETRISKFDLSLYSMEANEKLLFSFEYSTKLFKEETVERFANYFKSIVSGVLKNKDRKLSGIEIITGEEKHRVLYNFNNTGAVYPKDKTIHRIFEEQVKQTPDHTALIGAKSQIPNPKRKNISITYKELNEKSNQLARALRHKGVMQETIVAIIVERSVDMMIGILGILKAGGAYLPLDPIYPPERIKYILKDSSTSVIVTSENLNNFIDERYETLAVGDSELYRGENHNLELIGTSSQLAYVIYTSGSTGRPKGVMIQHRPLSNFIKGITGIIPFSVSDTVLSLTTVSFDIFGLETILPLTRGSKIIIGNMEEQVNAEETAQTIFKKGVTILQVTPSMLLMLVSHEASMVCLKKLEYLLVGGEAFPEQLLEKTRKLAGNKIYNMYGPTETTIWSTVKDVSAGEDLNIGKPIANTSIYILGKGNRIQPIGVHGELCISGDGLARGYVNRPELTAEKFDHDLWDYLDYHDEKQKVPGKNDRQSCNHASMPTPHHPNSPIPHSPYSPYSPIYRTGDLARWLPDGSIEFIGRLDHQVKIRGFRIELGEIESQLLQHKEIEETVVLAKQTAKGGSPGGEYQLYAYIVSGKTFTIPELREFLSNELPDYMLPSHFLQVEKIPLTPNGKVDRKILETYGTEVGAGVEYAAPRNSFEEKITDIWKEELNVDKIGIYDNFFELGGNSMNIVKISNRLKEITGKTISVMTMFRYPTVHFLSQYVSRENMKNTFSDEKIGESVQMMEDTALMFLEEDDE